jgi:integrase
VISLCAGDGRDLLEALSTHPRRADVHGLLVELDPDIAESARSVQDPVRILVTGLVTVAEMLGHARLDTVRTYTRPTAEDRAKALNLLPTDH